jgi:hypothetical protein
MYDGISHGFAVMMILFISMDSRGMMKFFLLVGLFSWFTLSASAGAAGEIDGFVPELSLWVIGFLRYSTII